MDTNKIHEQKVVNIYKPKIIKLLENIDLKDNNMDDIMFYMDTCGPARSDDTEPYSINFLKKKLPTVQEFVDYILTKHYRDWGDIYITTDKTVKTVWNLLGEKRKIKYRHGILEEDPGMLDQYGDRTITFASADGGWTRYDYLLVIE